MSKPNSENFLAYLRKHLWMTSYQSIVLSIFVNLSWFLSPLKVVPLQTASCDGQNGLWFPNTLQDPCKMFDETKIANNSAGNIFFLAKSPIKQTSMMVGHFSQWFQPGFTMAVHMTDVSGERFESQLSGTSSIKLVFGYKFECSKEQNESCTAIEETQPYEFWCHLLKGYTSATYSCIGKSPINVDLRLLDVVEVHVKMPARQKHILDSPELFVATIGDRDANATEKLVKISEPQIIGFYQETWISWLWTIAKTYYLLFTISSLSLFWRRMRKVQHGIYFHGRMYLALCFGLALYDFPIEWFSLIFPAWPYRVINASRELLWFFTLIFIGMFFTTGWTLNSITTSIVKNRQSLKSFAIFTLIMYALLFVFLAVSGCRLEDFATSEYFFFIILLLVTEGLALLIWHVVDARLLYRTKLDKLPSKAKLPPRKEMRSPWIHFVSFIHAVAFLFTWWSWVYDTEPYSRTSAGNRESHGSLTGGFNSCLKMCSFILVHWTLFAIGRFIITDHFDQKPEKLLATIKIAPENEKNGGIIKDEKVFEIDEDKIIIVEDQAVDGPGA